MLKWQGRYTTPLAQTALVCLQAASRQNRASGAKRSCGGRFRAKSFGTVSSLRVRRRHAL